MTNRKKRAIENIKNQIDKTKIESFDHDSWKTQSKSLIEYYLGKESEEYKSLSKPTIRSYSGYDFYGEKNLYDRNEAQSIKRILETSIQTITIKGLHKHQVPLLHKITEGWLIFILSTILTFIGVSFFIGVWVGENNMKSSTTPLVPNQKTEKATYTPNDTTHKKMGINMFAK